MCITNVIKYKWIYLDYWGFVTCSLLSDKRVSAGLWGVVQISHPEYVIKIYTIT
jgi:hypothetical protein